MRCVPQRVFSHFPISLPPDWKLKVLNTEKKTTECKYFHSENPIVFTKSWHELLVTPAPGYHSLKREHTYTEPPTILKPSALCICACASRGGSYDIWLGACTPAVHNALSPACLFFPPDCPSPSSITLLSFFFSPYSPSTPFSLAFLLLMLVLLLLSKHKLIHRGPCVI